MDKDVERVLLSQLEIQKQKLQNDIAELKRQIDETENKNNNNMSEQTQSPYAGRKLNADQVQYKTLFNEFIGQLDSEVSEALNDGWQPAGPQYKADVTFYQPMIKVPRQMMQPRP